MRKRRLAEEIKARFFALLGPLKCTKNVAETLKREPDKKLFLDSSGRKANDLLERSIYAREEGGAVYIFFSCGELIAGL